MTGPETFKKAGGGVWLVGVITGEADLRRGLAMNQPPDLFEIRLDYFDNINNRIRDRIARLPAPLIVTARGPGEGGAGNLSTEKRADLLRQFLPLASYIDVELRSANALAALLKEAKRKGIGCIMSFHDFDSTPGVRSLRTKAERAGRLGADLFKVATITDSGEQLRRLTDFITTCDTDVPLAVMGMGKLALESRVLLSAAGSIFAYASVGRPRVAGQPSLPQLRSALARAPKRLT